MSLHEWMVARRLCADDEPFYALLMAAALRADPANLHRLEIAFPEIVAEASQRYHAPAGLIPGDRDYDDIQRLAAAPRETGE